MPVYVGASGWQYKDWSRTFYPPGTGSLLEYYSARFRTVEINATFYRLPEKPVFEKWDAEASGDFRFAVKASRFLTHMKKLKDPEEPVARLLERCAGLKRKLAVILVQLPGNFPRHDERLEATLAAFPKNMRIAVEFRHESWFSDEVKNLLSRYKAALCLADRGGRLLTPCWKTCDWGYLRMHQGEQRPLPCYNASTLKERARMLAGLWKPRQDIFVYFNNDTGGCAIRDAVAFARAAEEAGLSPTRALL
ncbi:MAG: DUF72 domain-containing protein [Acidobacteriota bacterium]